MTGGGAASLYDPLDVTEFFEEEIRAAVRAAEDWGTYVMVHVYNPWGIARAIKAGVRSIEHGHLIDEPTMKLLADSGAWLSMQAFTVEDNTYPSPVQQAKHLQICNGTDPRIRTRQKYNVKLAWGTDLLFNPAHTKNQNHGIVKLQKWFSNFEILKMVTSDNARLLAMSEPETRIRANSASSKRARWPTCCWSKEILYRTSTCSGDPGNNFSVIIKNGVVYKKNKLQDGPASGNR